MTVAHAPAPALAPGERIGAFVVEERLGEGGMGVVYRAHHAVLERPVALKVMRPDLAADPQYRERFLREARAAAAVHDPHVVPIHDAGEHQGALYLAFAFMPGGDLEGRLHRQGPLPWEEAVRLSLGVARGLEAIHAAGLVHRDLKPANVLLDARGRPCIADLGLARKEAGDDRLTVTGVGMGTPSYMAPEQAAGQSDIDIRADLHALGATLYHLLTGRPPYSGATPWMVVNAVMNQAPPNPCDEVRGLPPGLGALVVQALAKRREERPQDPTAFAAALGRLLPGAAVTTDLPVGGWDWRAPYRQGGWWWLLLVAAVMLVLPLPLWPIQRLADGYRPWLHGDPGFWGVRMALTAAAAVWLWAPLRRRQGVAPGRAQQVPGLLLAAAGVGCLVGYGFAALRAALGLDGGGWSALNAVLVWLAVPAWLGWTGWELSGDRTGLAQAAWTRRLWWGGLGALGAIIACHLVASQRTGGFFAEAPSALALGVAAHALALIGVGLLVARR